MKKLILLVLFFAPQTTFATSDFCEFLEGIPLPACFHSKYHTCKSGVAQIAQYYPMRYMINTIDDPATSTCAQNQNVCTTTCSSGSDGGGCSTNCQCKAPQPQPQSCHTNCQQCITNTKDLLDEGVTCQWFCNKPPHFPGAISGPAGTYINANTSNPPCSEDQKCQPPAVDVGGPKSASECPQLPSPQPFKVDDYNYDPKNPTGAAACCWSNSIGRDALIAAHSGDSTYVIDNHKCN